MTANISSRKGAWLGSWNIQSDSAQFSMCGWPEFIEETRSWGGSDIADDYTYCCQARAKLMERLQVTADEAAKVRDWRSTLKVFQGTVSTIEDFQAMCRHNDYLHDAESACNCTAQVSSSSAAAICILVPTRLASRHLPRAKVYLLAAICRPRRAWA
jgi:hypothetical protein